MAVRTICLTKRATLFNRSGQLRKHFFGVFPINASIGDTDSILKARFTFLRDFLISYNVLLVSVFNCCGSERTFVDVTFNHDTHDRTLSSGYLLGDDTSNLWLIFVILL
jgi:hypothetical protein